MEGLRPVQYEELDDIGKILYDNRIFIVEQETEDEVTLIKYKEDLVIFPIDLLN